MDKGFFVKTGKGITFYQRKEKVIEELKKELSKYRAAERPDASKPRWGSAHEWSFLSEKKRIEVKFTGKTLYDAVEKNIISIARNMSFADFSSAIEKIQLKERDGRIFLIIFGWKCWSRWKRDEIARNGYPHNEDYCIEELEIMGVTPDEWEGDYEKYL